MRHFLKACWSFVRLGRVIFIDNRRRTHTLLRELQGVLDPYDLQLPADLQKRIFVYTAISAITNHWFSLLRGWPPTAAEERDALYLGAFSPLTDDLMDGTGQTFDELISRPGSETPIHILFHYVAAKLQPVRSQLPLFDHYYRQSQHAQNASLRQLDRQPLDLDTLIRITFDKGGYTTNLHRMVLQNPPVPGEEEAWYTLGSILQLLNDLFDVYKDHQQGVQTLVTRTADMHFVSRKLQELEDTFRRQFFALDYPPGGKAAAYRAMMAVVSRGRVALAQYRRLQGDEAHLDIGAFPRKPLIVDMERPRNVWQNILETVASTTKR